MKRKISTLLAITFIFLCAIAELPVTAANSAYQAPESPSRVYNMNIDWKYLRPDTAFPLADAIESAKQGDMPFYAVDYDDSDWETVSVPHAINAADSFDDRGDDNGERDLYRGFSFYRKHITIPESDRGKKVFLEFEAVRQTIYLYVNGELVGYYEAGVNATGYDITDYLNENGDNVIAVATDNSAKGTEQTNITRETRPGSIPGDLGGDEYQWNTTDFNPVQGGITGNVTLYMKGEIYQTLPLYNNLKTTGNYIYATDFDIKSKTAKITVESEIRNVSGADKDVTAEVNIVDMNGARVASFTAGGTAEAAQDADLKILSTVPDDAYASSPADTNADTVDVSKIVVSGTAHNLNFWSPDTPYLYDVYTVLKDGDTVLDVDKQTTGFRKVEYDITGGGIKINDEPVWLTGYAQRATNEWAAIGVATDWLTDMDMQLVKESNANFIRWMHIAPKPAAIRSGDKYGVVSVCPGADRETDGKNRVWDTRVEAMRDTVIYFRNSPSILFWEAGNQSIKAEHMEEMAKLIDRLDPHGGRFSGSRSLGEADQLAHATFTGSILGKTKGQITAQQTKETMAEMGRYMPIIESEHSREEAPRRVWDDFSPPDYDYRNRRSVNGSKQLGYDIYDHTSESFTVLNIKNYATYYGNRVGGQEGTDYYAGAAALCWTDSNQHVRNAGSENCRTSGRVDPVRIKKESFYAYQVMQSEESKCYILGHWSYPQLSSDTYNYREKEKNTETNYYEETGAWGKRDPKNKTIYVVGTPDIARMALYINGEFAGMDTAADSYFLFEFKNIDITQSGKIEAIGYNAKGKEIARHEIETAQEPAALRLTPVTGPEGLRADGSDIAYYDVEVVDAAGRVCPLSYDKINFTIEGNGVFLGGYNSGEERAVESYGRSVENADGAWTTENEIGQSFVYAECGVNRVFVRSTRDAGAIRLTAEIDGSDISETVTVGSNELALVGGLTTALQQARPQDEITEKTDGSGDSVEMLTPLAKVFTATAENSRVVAEAVEEKDEYSILVNGAEVHVTAKAYKPDDPAGVVGEIVPILDAIAAVGGNVTYTIQTEGDLPANVEGTLPMVTIVSGNNTIYLANEMTTLTVVVNGETSTNVTNWPTGYANGQLMPELTPVLNYISGVTTETDADAKTYNITVKSN